MNSAFSTKHENLRALRSPSFLIKLRKAELPRGPKIYQKTSRSLGLAELGLPKRVLFCYGLGTPRPKAPLRFGPISLNLKKYGGSKWHIDMII
jgi:hypothetical protein